MNAEFDRDLTSAEQEQLSGSCSSGMTCQRSLWISSCTTPPLSRPGAVNPNPLGCDTRIFADRPIAPYPANQPVPAFRHRLAVGVRQGVLRHARLLRRILGEAVGHIVAILATSCLRSAGAARELGIAMVVTNSSTKER